MYERRISVIIPVYNVEKYLPRCLDSIIKNTFGDLEIICVNDGSTDDSLNILTEYAERDDRIIVLNKENGGSHSARNAGLAIAKGEYIAFIDADDWIHRSYFEVLMQYAETFGADITICGYTKTKEYIEDEPVNYSQIKNYTVSGLKLLDDTAVTYGYIWARLYTKESVEKQVFRPIRVMDDAAFNFDVLSSNEKITCFVCDARLYYSFQRPGSLVASSDYKVHIKAAEYYYSHLATGTGWEKHVFAIEVLKNCFLCRYNVAYDKTGLSFTRNNTTMMRGALEALLSSPYSSLKQKIVYSVMTVFPSVYRLFRIKNDPTLLQWEKSKKRS